MACLIFVSQYMGSRPAGRRGGDAALARDTQLPVAGRADQQVRRRPRVARALQHGHRAQVGRL